MRFSGCILLIKILLFLSLETMVEEGFEQACLEVETGCDIKSRSGKSSPSSLQKVCGNVDKTRRTN